MRDAYGHGIDRMLMLGGGGFAYPKFALLLHEGLRMDVIEYDAEITRLARRWFYLDELERAAGDRLRVITAEARSYLGVTSVGHRRYDVVVSDCFGGAEPVRGLATVEALRLVRGSLNPGGIYVANIVSANEGSDVTFLRDCAATALEVFDHAWVVPCGDAEFGGEENYLLIASDGDYAFAEAVPFDADFLGAALHDQHWE